MDIINLACNENDSKKDFSLAFIGAYSKTRTCSLMMVVNSLW